MKTLSMPVMENWRWDGWIFDDLITKVTLHDLFLCQILEIKIDLLSIDKGGQASFCMKMKLSNYQEVKDRGKCEKYGVACS